MPQPNRRPSVTRMERVVAIVTLALGLVLLLPTPPAHAYIDPGSGALIWQGLVAAGVGALFYVRRFFQALRGKRGETNPADRTGEEPTETPR